MFCKKCGAQIKDNAAFCNVCGAPVTVRKPVPPAENKDVTGKSDKWFDDVVSEFEDNKSTADTGFSGFSQDEMFDFPGDMSERPENSGFARNDPPAVKREKSSSGLKYVAIALVSVALTAAIFVGVYAVVTRIKSSNAPAETTQTESTYSVPGNTAGYSENTTYYYQTTTEPVTEKEHIYRVVASDCTWTEANAECSEKGGHLVTITSQDEYEKVCRLADESGLSYLWMGARIYSTGDNWGSNWITGEDWTYSNWFPGEPSKVDSDGTPEYYLCLWNVKYKGQYKGWTFNDQRNDIIGAMPSVKGKIGYIIEFD